MSLRYKGPNVLDTKTAKVGALRKFGVELEVSDAPCWEGLDGQTVFACKSDGSVDGDGLEFVSPILQGDAGLEAVASLCDYAENAGWDCDSSCGFHLHIDTADLTDEQRKRIYYAYKLTEDLWHKFVSSRRNNNSYCRNIHAEAEEIKAWDWNECLDKADHTDDGRYIWCNIIAFHSHSTIEIRLHHGTIDKDVVTAWIKAHLRFVEIVRGMTLAQLDTMFADKATAGAMLELERIWRDADLSRFYRRRASNYKQPVHA